MIYLAFYLAKAALLIALPLAWIAGCYMVARIARRHVRQSLVTSAIAACIASVPFMWIGYAWHSFRQACSGLKPLAQFASVEPQGSVLLRLDLGFDFGKDSHMQIGPILERVGPVCVEREFWRPMTDRQTQQTSRFERRCGQQYARANELVSRYAVAMSVEKDISGLGYLLTYRVEGVKDGKTVAEAREAIFGRGLLSQYIGLFGGSNNAEYLACGYVDDLPRIWRNTRAGSGHPDHEAYKAMDQRLFEIAVGRPVAR